MTERNGVPGVGSGIDADRWALALEAGGVGAWEWNLVDNSVWWSPRVHEITRVPSGEFGGTLEDFVALVHPDERPTVRAALESAVHSGATFNLEIRLTPPEGGEVWVAARGTVVADSDGVARAMVGTAIDITGRKATEAAREQLLREEQRARAAAESARERLAFLISAGRQLRAVLDPEVVRRTAVELVVRDLGDWAVMLDPSATMALAVAAQEVPPGTLSGEPLRLAASADLLGSVLATGEPRIGTGPVELVIGEGGSTKVALGATSVVALPLVLGSERVGVLIAGHRRTGRPYDTDDLELFAQFAEALAATLVKASLFKERSAIARVLQQSLLPASLPTVEGIEIGTEYLPVGEGLIVGGDFYDVFRVADKRYAFAVGDVSGKGSEAAAVTALVRHSIRAFAETFDDPAAVLVAVNDAVRIHGPTLRYCTAAFGVLDVSDGAEIEVAVGGHPLPLILGADGSIAPVGRPGTLLGMFTEVSVTPTRHRLEPGDALVLYTDGVVEARRNGVPFGDDRLVSLLRDSVGHGARTIAGRVGAAVAEYHDEPDDDVAILVIRRLPSP